MLRRSIIGARYSMMATIIRPGSVVTDPEDPENTGTWVVHQDPDTGEIVRVWQPLAGPDLSDNPDTANPDTRVEEIWCMARGIVDGGIRAAATTEDFDAIYRNVDIINMWVPKKYQITKRDRVTNIRSRDGKILWRDEELEGPGITKATVFNVNGVIPVFDPFNKHLDNFCLLERAEV